MPLTCSILYSGAYLEIKGNHHQNKKNYFSSKREPFLYFWGFLKEETAFSYVLGKPLQKKDGLLFR